jgi:hypothetical protein
VWLALAIVGRVFDVSTGESLARVKVALVESGVETVTGAKGEFSIDADAGTLRVTAVGYRPFQLKLGQARDYEIGLAPDTLRQNSRLDVTAGVFQEESPRAVGLAGNELKNLASVLADDPLRAVQGLPGVASNDDFQSQFSLRGAAFKRIGIYLDGVLLHSPFHTVQGDATSASLAIFNGETLDSVNLHPGAPPIRFADRTAGALDVRTREGDRRRFSVRGTASASNAGLMAEGPLGRGSWLAAARKSYLQYIIERTSDEPSLAFGFSDLQGRVQQDLGKAWNVALGVLHGSSGLDRAGAEQRVGLNALFRSDYNFTLATATLRFTPGRAVLATSRAAFLREDYRNDNRERRPIGAGAYGEWVWNSDLSWQQSSAASLDVGASVRRLRDDGYFNRLGTGTQFLRLDRWRGTGVRSGAYAQQSWSAPRGLVQLMAGARVDRHGSTGQSVANPFASVAVQPVAATRVSVAWGQYAQFADMSELFSLAGSLRLLPERSTHSEIAVEQRLGDRTRLRLQAYQRHDRDLLVRPLYDPRLIGSILYFGNLLAPIANAQRGAARGWQAFLQRRTANGFTGWASYAWGRARADGAPADFDQRHTMNLFGGYRLRPSVNLSGRWAYGSGFPVRGYFAGTQGNVVLSAQRNQLRLPAYQRTDFRVNKAFIRDRWQITLFAEVVNLTNRDNVRFDDVGSVDARGRVRLNLEKTFPILPSAGVAVEF